MDFFLQKGLEIVIISKDLQTLNPESNLFLVVIRQKGDELYYPWTLPEEDMNKLRQWIRCGDPTNTVAEWKSVWHSECNLKTYLAGENPGIDCHTDLSDDCSLKRRVLNILTPLRRSLRS